MGKGGITKYKQTQSSYICSRGDFESDTQKLCASFHRLLFPNNQGETAAVFCSACFFLLKLSPGVAIGFFHVTLVEIRKTQNSHHVMLRRCKIVRSAPQGLGETFIPGSNCQ